ncbi:MAG: DUF4118 domain-containing protein [Acidobacteriota bacterium]
MALDSSKFISKPAWFRFGLALCFVAAALAATNLLWLFVDRPSSSPLFLGAIVLSAWLGGFRPGVLAAIVGGICIDYFFVSPYHVFTGDREELTRLAIFVFEGLIMSWLIERIRTVSDGMKASREELRALTKYQQTLRESEQKRIAREIHDELGQVLTGLKMDVHLLKRRLNSPDADLSKETISDDLDDLGKVIDVTISSVRRIASELRPSMLDDFGLVAAIEWQAQEFERKTEIPCLFKADTDSLDLGAESNMAVFRIFQEALTNVARHSEAKQVQVDFQTAGGDIVMTVRDDGKGIDMRGIERSRSLGILGMHERTRLIGGELDIAALPDGGTAVELTVPATAKYSLHLN